MVTANRLHCLDTTATYLLVVDSSLDTHLRKFLLRPLSKVLTLSRLPATLDIGPRNTLYNHRARGRIHQRRVRSQIILAHNLHLTFLPRDVISPRGSSIPLLVPRIQDEEHCVPETILPLIERQRRLGRDAQRDRLGLSIRSLVCRERLGLAVHAHRHTLESGPDADRVGDLGAFGDFELGRILEGVRLRRDGVVLPGHLRHPRSVDEISVEGGEEGLIARRIIDGGSTRIDHGVTAAGLVNDILGEPFAHDGE